MKKIISLLLCVCLTAGLLGMRAAAQTKPELRFDADGTFTVLHLTDTQDDAAVAHELADFIEKAIATAQPDLIVLTGDIVENSRVGDLTTDDEPLREGVTANEYEQTLANAKKAVEQIFAPLEASGIPYAVTQGNNDYSSEVTNEDWLAIYASYPNCITFDESNDSEGKIDTYFEILASDSNEAAFGLWMLDNGKGFTAEQAEWMRNYETEDVPSIVFEHIPTDDVGNLFESCMPWQDGAFISDGGCYRLNPELAYGHAEIAATPGTTTDDFRLWKEKNVIGAFFGHEHTCGYTGTFDGITMGLTYGCQFAKSGPYGMRTLTLSEDGTFDTDLYTYEKGTFTLQTDAPYNDGAQGFEKVTKSIFNFFKCLFLSLAYALKL